MEINVIVYSTCAKTATARDNWGSSEKQHPMAGMSYSCQRPPIFERHQMIQEHNLLFFSISQRSYQDVPFDCASGSLIHSYKLGAINSTRGKKKNLTSDTVSLFISITICFKADPPQYDKYASLFS